MRGRCAAAPAALLAAGLSLIQLGCRHSPVYDLIVRGGTVIDGTGSPPFDADIAIAGDRIEAIGNLKGASALRVISADGLVVSPGFVDLNGQSGVTLLVDGGAESHIRQGITTELIGERSTPALWTDRQDGAQLEQNGVQVSWTSFREYLDHLKSSGISLNVGSFVPADMVRREILGQKNRHPTQAELRKMIALVRQAMADGAFGLASALTYAPGSYASREELTELARAVGGVGGVYITHVRGETSRPLDAIREAIAIGRDARLPVIIFHLKLGAKNMWGKTSELRTLIENARAEGVDVSATQYPYTAGGTDLMACLPPWVMDGGREKARERLRDSSVRARIRREIETDAELLGWENLVAAAGFEGIQIASASADVDQSLVGRHVSEIAADANVSPWQMFFDLVMNERVGATFHMMSETDVEHVMQMPWVSISTDSAAVHTEGPLATGIPHPRAYGTYPRVLGHYVRDRQLMPLSEAVRKMTGLPAAQARLSRRGLLRAGYFADLVIFDSKTVSDQGTYARPAVYPTGIIYVVVNGTVTLDGGRHTGARAGRPLFGPGLASSGTATLKEEPGS